MEEVIATLTKQAMDYVEQNKVASDATKWGESTDADPAKEADDSEYFAAIKRAADSFGVNFSVPPKVKTSTKGETKLAAQEKEGEGMYNEGVTKRLVCMVCILFRLI